MLMFQLYGKFISSSHCVTFHLKTINYSLMQHTDGWSVPASK